MTAADVVAVARVALAVAPTRLAYAEENAAIIAAHWKRAASGRPGLYNGGFFLFEEHPVVDGVFRAVGHRADYATFLYWREQGFPDLGFAHLFPVGAMVTADGYLLLGEMAGGTANAGRCYPPSGSFDPSDVLDGRLDVVGNIVREIAEETGIEIARADCGAIWLVVADRPNCFGLVTPVRVAVTGAELVARAESFLARQTTPELARVFCVPLDRPLPDLVAAPYVARVMPVLADLV